MRSHAMDGAATRDRRPPVHPSRRRAGVLLAAMLLGGCVVAGPDYVPPEVATPEQYFSEAEGGIVRAPARSDSWWDEFGDETLARLVARALERNLGLREALERIDEARAFRGIVTPDLFPTVDVGGAYSRDRVGEETATPRPGDRTSDAFGLGLESSWEVDLWGRVRRSVEAADADVDTSVEDARDAIVSVAAETALAYVDLRRAQERERIARANVDLQQSTLVLTHSRFDAGLVGELDVAQAASLLESTRSTVPALQARARAARNRIAVLLGEWPGALEAELAAPGAIPAPPPEIAVGIPAELLARRPDVRAAERRLAAQTARIGVAEGDLYPRLTLSGNIGLDADDVGSLFTGGALGFGIGPSITWNVFDRGRIHSRVAIESSRARRALLRHERTVLGALEEVENAVTGFVRDKASRDSLAAAVAHSRRAVELSREQYRQGLVGFQSVLDTQRRLFELEDALVSTEASIAANVIFLFRALGGGWRSHDVVLHERKTNASGDTP